MSKPKPKQSNRTRIIAALKKHATITLACEPEDLVIEGNASARSEKEDRETEQWIHSQLDAGNEWAWCTTVVTVSYKGFSASDVLGACSYHSEADFRQGGYFTDMVHNASAELADKLVTACAAIYALLGKR